MKNSLNNQYKLQSFLIALCLLISVSSFSKESDLVFNTLDLQTVTPTISSFSPLEGYAGTIVTIEGQNFPEITRPVVTLNEENISSGIISYSATRIVLTIPCNATSGYFKVDGIASATQFLFIPPVLSNSLTASVCSGMPINYQARSSNSNTVLSWTRRPIIGSITQSPPINSALGDIGETLDNSTDTPIDVYYDYTLTLNGCSNTQVVTVTVNPKPKLKSSLTPTAVCSGANFSYTPDFNISVSSFNWSRATQTDISQNSNEGSATISEILTTTSDASVGVNYDFDFRSNLGCSSTETVRVNVTPLPSTPVSIDGDKTVCIGSKESYTVQFPSTSNAISYRWTLPNGSVTNTTSATLLIDYSVVTSSGNLSVAGVNSCGVGVAYSQYITIQPSLEIVSPLPDPICSGTLFEYTAQSSNTSAVLKWTRAAVPGISNSAEDSPKIGKINETLFNTTDAPIDVEYKYTLTLNSCTNEQTIKVTVNPKPKLKSSLTPTAVCSGANFSYTPDFNISVSSFNWSRATQTDISQNSNEGSATISEILTTTSDASVGVNYDFDFRSNLGCSSTETVRVNVTPLPSTPVSIDGDKTVCIGSKESYTVQFPSTSNAISYRWTLPNGSVTNTTSATLLIDYSVVTSSGNLSVAGVNSCGVGVAYSQYITIQPSLEIVSPLPDPICSGTLFEYTAQSSNTSAVLKWTRAAVPGISNSAEDSPKIGKINETLFNTTDAPIDVEYKYTLTLNSCTNEQTIKVTVNPKPKLKSSLTPTAVCSGANFSYTPDFNISVSSFNWSRATQTDISQNSNEGSATISEILTTTSDASVGVNYDFDFRSNLGCSSTETVRVNVTPLPSTPVSIDGDKTVCIGSKESYTVQFPSTSNAISYRWTLPNGSVTNTTSATLLIDYSVVTSSGNLSVAGVNSCGVGVAYSQYITIQPSLEIVSPLPDPICSGTLFEYTAQSSNTSAVLKWTRAAVPGISNSAEDSPKIGKINETLFNTTDAPIDVEYKYTLTLNSCTNEQTIKVTVNPKPKLKSSLTPTAVCSGANFSYTPDFNISVSSFNWSRATQTDISQNSNEGSATISEILTTTSDASVGVNYDFDFRSNLGCSSTETVRVNVTPLPSTPVSIDGDKTVCIGSKESYTVQFPSTSNAISYRWTLPNGSVTNTTSATLLIDYSVVTSSGNLSVAGVNSCGVGVAYSQYITIQPSLEIVSPLPDPICSGTLFEYTAQSSNTSAVLKWTRAAVPGISNSAEDSPKIGNINEILINETPLPIDVVYIYTLALNGCTNTQAVTVTVNPNAILLNPPSNVVICSGTTFNFEPTTSIDGTEFRWTSGTRNGEKKISERLVNNGSSPIDFEFKYKLETSEGCLSQERSFTVEINRQARLFKSPAETSFCTPSNEPELFEYDLETNSGVDVYWSREENSEISEPASLGKNGKISEWLTTKSTTSTVYVNYTFFLDDTAYGCDATQSLSVTLEKRPEGKPVISGYKTICAGSENNVYKASKVDNATKYIWSFPNGASKTTSSPEVVLPKIYSSGFLKVKGINDCGDADSSDDFLITVIPLPTLTPLSTPPTVCSGTNFKYDPLSADIDTKFSWTRPDLIDPTDPEKIVTGLGSINEILINTTNRPIDALYKYVLETPGGCKNIDYLTVKVNPTPNLPEINEVVCSGTEFKYTPSFSLPVTSFNWTRVNVVGIDPLTLPIVSTPTELKDTLINLTTTPIEVIYQITATSGSCSKTSELKVLVNPLPSPAKAITGPITVCKGSAGNVYSVALIPNATSYQWTLPAGATITDGLDSTGLASNRITVSFSSTAVLGNITVKGVNSCGVGIASVLSVTLLSLPTLTPLPTPPTICSGSKFSYEPRSTDTSTTFEWTRTDPTDNTIIISSGTGNIDETLINTTTTPINVSYQYTLKTPGGCENIQYVTVTVNPTPNLPVINEVACSGTEFKYTPSFSLPVTSFNWTRVNVVGIDPLTLPIVSTPTELKDTLINLTTTPIEVIYQITATSGSCSKTSELKVLVNPLPSPAKAITGPITVCKGSAGNVYSVALIPNATSYQWTLPAGATITDGLDSTGLASNRITVSFSSTAVLGNITVKGVNSCGVGIASVLSVTLLSLPTLTPLPTPPTICSGSKFSYEPRSTDTSTTFEWTRTDPTDNTIIISSGTGNIDETLINTTTTPINVSYQYTLKTPGGCENIQYVTVTVNPTPNLPVINEVACSGTEFKYTPSFSLPVTSFNWTRVNVVGIDPLTLPIVSTPTELKDTLINLTTTPIEVIYQITATSGSCSKTSELKVLVNPLPSPAKAITGPITVCKGSAGNVYSVALIPNATSYQWTLPAGATITDGLDSTGLASNRITVSFSSTAVLGNITVKGVNSCGVGIASVLSVTLLSLPTLTPLPTPPTICSGSKFSYEPRSTDTSTTFEWTRTDLTDNTIIISSGTGNIDETLINTTTTPINVSYQYTLKTPGGCENIQYVTVTVNPTPNLPVINEVACSGTEFKYTPSFSLPVTSFNWTRVNVVGIDPLTLPIVSTPTELKDTLINLTTTPIEVIYQITATSGSCSKTSELKVLVNPLPSPAKAITGPITVCKGSAGNVYSVALIPNATSYQWTLPAGATITDGLDSTGLASNRITVSFSNTAESGNITVKGVNSCGGGAVFSLPITVNQNATINLVSGIPNTTLCIGSFVNPIKYAISPNSEVLKLTGVLPAGVTFTAATGIIMGTPTESGSFPFTITSTSNCSNSLSGIIVVNPLQSITKLSGVENQIACINTPIDPIVYAIPSGITGVIINPVLPSGIVATVDVVNGLVSISGTPTVATSLAQNYIVETQGSCGPSARATISFDIKPAVILDFLSSTASLNQAVCLNGPIEPIRFSIGGGATGIIQPVLPAGLTFSFDLVSGVYTIQGNPTANGTFTIPITTTGCNKTVVITISNVNTAVSIELKSALGTDQQTLCQSNFNSPITPIQYTMIGATSVQVVGLPAGVNFSYNSTTSELVISGTPTQTGIFNYTITSLPCSIIKTGVLKVSIPMFISSESIKNVSCSTASNGEIAVTIIGGVPIAGQYAVTWTGPNNFQQNRLNLTGLQAGEYTLTGKDAVGCLLPTKKYTVLPASPILISLISTINVTCSASLGCANFNFTGGSGTYTNFNLQYLDPSLQMWATVSNPSNNYFNICNLKAGLYRLTVTDSNSCTTEPFQFTIYDYSMLKIDGVNLDNSLCVNTAGKVRVTVSSLDHNLTFFYNGILVPSVDLGNNKYELSIASPTAPSGIIKVANSQNCWDTKTVDITIIEPKIAFSSTNLTTYGLISVNESVKFTNGLTVANIPAEYDYIVWDFGDYSPQKVFDNPTEILPNALGESITTVFHSFVKDGLYPVTLTAYNQFGCSKSITEIVTVGQGASIMSPSAFSPNGDGINDLFRPSLLGLKEVSMYIYDNWGNLVFEFTSDVASLPSDWGWNGIEKVNSEPINGTYRYYISAITINDSTIEKDGQFILIK